MSKLSTKIDDSFSYEACFLERLNLKEKSEITFEYVSDFRSAKIIREFIIDLCNRL